MSVKKLALRISAIILILIMAFSAIPVSAIGPIEETGDTTYDTFTFWEKSSNNGPIRARGMFNLNKVLFTEDLGAGNIASFTDISFDKNDNLYLLDSDASRVIAFDKDYKYTHSFSAVVDPNDPSVSYTFTGAKGFVAAENGDLYICDTANARVLICDNKGNLKDVLLLPESTLIPENFVYSPIKVAVDSSNYIYVLSDGSYYGAILYSPEGDFLGFYGANTVKATILQALEKIWNEIIMTNARRATAERELPFQFTDLYVDNMDFIYTSTGQTERGSSTTGQIKRLSPGGLNILKSDDTVFGVRKQILKTNDKLNTNLIGLAVNDDKYIFTFDANNGYIFVYDDDCRLLNAFGGGSALTGNQQGLFDKINAIDVNSRNDIVLIDNAKGAMTIFSINDYGKLVFEAGNYTRAGDYENARPLWEKVLTLDRNSQVAYSGLARTYFAEGRYSESMKYAKQGFDYQTYSSSFEYVRRFFLEKHLNWMLPVLLVVVVLVVLLVFYKKKHNIKLIKSEEIRLVMRVMLHPSDVFAEVKQKGKGSVVIGFILIAIYYITATIKETNSGFLFKSASITSFNSVLLLLQTLGLVFLWTICNWAVCTLLDGKGKVKEIFIVTSYSLVPLIISNIVYTIVSNALLSSESSFLSIFVTVMTLFTAFILISGTILIHDYSFAKFVGTSILTLLGILIVLFLMIAVIILVQQAGAFFGTVYRELVYRG